MVDKYAGEAAAIWSTNMTMRFNDQNISIHFTVMIQIRSMKVIQRHEDTLAFVAGVKFPRRSFELLSIVS